MTTSMVELAPTLRDITNLAISQLIDGLPLTNFMLVRDGECVGYFACTIHSPEHQELVQDSVSEIARELGADAAVITLDTHSQHGDALTVITIIGSQVSHMSLPYTEIGGVVDFGAHNNCHRLGTTAQAIIDALLDATTWQKLFPQDDDRIVELWENLEHQTMKLLV